MKAAAFDVQSLGSLRNTQKAQTPEGVRQMAQEFETLFLQSMMKSMRATVPQDSFWHSDAEKLYTSLLDQQLAYEMATTNGGLGFGKEIEKHIARQMGVDLNGESKSEKTAESFSTKTETQEIVFPTLNIFERGNVESSAPQMATAAKIEETPASPKSPAHAALAMSPLFEIADLLYSAAPVAASAPKDFEKNLLSSVENPISAISNAADLNAEVAKFSAVSALPKLQNSAQDSAQNFVANVWDDAQKAAAESGLNPAHIVAHAALESGWGKHQPGGAKNPSFNLFGIKADPSWQGKRVVSRTTEFENGELVSKLQAFRAYDSYEEAFLDYAEFLQNNPRYAAALSAQTAQEFAQNLQKAGYATDPQYAAKLQRTIEKTQQYLRS